MKPALRKTHQLSIVRSESTSEDATKDPNASLKEFFSGWLDSVAPELSSLPPEPSGFQRPRYRNRSMTSTDMVRVNRATVRESTDHRHWPPEVVQQFLTAKVITRNNKQP